MHKVQALISEDDANYRCQETEITEFIYGFLATSADSKVLREQNCERQSEGDRRTDTEAIEGLHQEGQNHRAIGETQRTKNERREKMGLISNDRAKEIETMKKKKSESGSPAIMGTPGLDLITLGLVDTEKIPKARQVTESTLLRLKKEAIQALPEHLKGAALVLDLTPFPMNRFMATLTSPIEGHFEKINEAARNSSVKEKLR
ncbi:hypothetical protein Acr_11g0017080 [Actinidia rufa]|uniref:Uncharacterized protein n=1 Tax=Actinidia rufa TaxID=165716 RepID=A0A7J0FFC6_9ERIC|nr:hypothetical protein Acr_11g0017080 [Actinidia rufa]